MMKHTVELLPTLSLELILAPQERRYSTMAVWPVLVATCRGVLYNCNVDIDIHCDCEKHIQDYLYISITPTVCTQIHKYKSRYEFRHK